MTATAADVFADAAPEDKPYALSSVEERLRRKAMMSLPHMAPIAGYLTDVRAVHPDKTIPDPDPCDGGTRARALFVLEAPGPKAVLSGFVSRNNPDPTAKNMCLFLRTAGIARRDTLITNIVPWYVGRADFSKIRPVTPADRAQALPHLGPLLDLLPDLQVIVLIGGKAQASEAQIRRLTNVPFVKTHHPSGQVVNTRPAHKADIGAKFAGVAAVLRGENNP